MTSDACGDPSRASDAFGLFEGLGVGVAGFVRATIFIDFPVSLA